MTATDTQAKSVDTDCDWIEENIWDDLRLEMERRGSALEPISIDVTEAVHGEERLPFKTGGVWRWNDYKLTLASFAWHDKRAIATYEVEAA